MSGMFAKLFPRRFNARSSLTELAADIWAIDERLEPLLDEITRAITNASVTELAAAERDDECDCEGEEGCECEEHDQYMKVENGIAHIPIDGLLVSRGAQIFRYFGIAATGYNEISAALAEAKKRDDIKEVVLHVNSPGGSVTGLQSTASKIFSLRRSKPVSAHASGMVASAAYWLASQAGYFSAEEGTEVGSIGVYATVEDSSRMFEDAGIKVHMLRSGEHKGVGEPGVPISDRQLNKLQKSVNRSAAEFVAAIVRGRDLKQSEVERLATGETWSAKDAVDHRLIDAVDSIDEPAAIEFPNQAPGGAQEEDRMSNKDGAVDLTALKGELLADLRTEFDTKLNAKLEEERAKYETKLAEANAAVASIKEDQKRKLIDQAAAEGRIVPASRGMVEKFAATANVEDLASFLSALPQQTNPTMSGSSGGTNKRHKFVSDGESHLAGLLGLEPEDISGEFADAVGVTTDGKLIRRDGSVADAKALLRKGVN